MSINTDKTKAVHKHQHQHTHSGGGDCSCHSHSSNSERDCIHAQDPLEINGEERSILLELEQSGYLPVSRFVMSSSTEKEARFVSLAPVYINALDDSMETVKKIGVILSALEKKGLISLNYDIPLQDNDYIQHTNSVLFAYFTETINEGKKNPRFLCDTAEIELGSIELTEAGERIIEHIRHESV